jgi:CO/xanthine dehydrogenase FAD-binding subunit
MSEAAQALTADRGARFLAGGTFVMRAVNEGDVSIATVVRTTDPEMRQIRTAGERIVIGAAVTMSAVAQRHETEFLVPVARAIGGPAVRNMATVGGNLFARPPYGDFTAALLALEATVSLAGGAGVQELPLEEFLRRRDEQAHGLVASVSVRRPQMSGAFRIRRLQRVHPVGEAVMSIAAHLPQSGGRVQNARIAYCGMAPTPVRMHAVERALEGRGLDDGGIAAALAIAVEGLDPPADAIASSWYRREVAPVLLKRLLLGRP